MTEMIWALIGRNKVRIVKAFFANNLAPAPNNLLQFRYKYRIYKPHIKLVLISGIRGPPAKEYTVFTSHIIGPSCSNSWPADKRILLDNGDSHRLYKPLCTGIFYGALAHTISILM